MGLRTWGEDETAGCFPGCYTPCRSLPRSASPCTAGLNLEAIYLAGVAGDLIELAIAVDDVKKAKKALE